ncbi:MAG: hypothetical protein LBM61_03080, partial [Prevotellaceae bacterium]|nr:hypothetical protein [Prevotellaceae bacterium]
MKQISFLIIGWILIFSLPQTTHGQTTVAFEHLMQSYAERSANALSPDSFFVDLQNLQRELPRTTDTVQRAVLHALLTDLYGRYIHHKWFSLQQITPVVDEDTLIHDMRQWTLAQYQDALRFHGSEALKDTAALLSSTTAKYPALIKQGTGSVYYHHDMYHLLVQIVTSALEHPSFDDYSESIRQIRNTQREVYRRRNNRSALALDTLERLREKEYAKTTNDISQEYDWLLQTYGKLPVGIEIYIGYIRYLANDYPIERTNRYLRALKLCDEAAVRYPRTDRLSEVRYYREKILLPSFFATVSGIYPDSLMKISVTSRNITRLRATIMRGSYEIIKRDYQIISPVNVNRIDTILELRTPGVGLYTLKLENINDGEPTKNVQPLRVTRLALLWNALPKKKGEAIVTDAYSGKPMKASILVNGKSYPTDDEGRATFQIEERAFIKAICENDTAMEEQRIWPQAERTSTTGTLRGTLFTDRFLYRPGQLVQVKGVLYRQRGDSTRVATDVSDTLMLRDNFGKTIATRQVTTNEFGSFVTEFTLPANGVNGIYRIYYDQQIQTYIRVEAYKRPTFEISIDKPKGAYRLGDSIVLTGQVKTFSGIPLAHATVRYRLRSTHHRPYQFIPQDFEVGEVVADGNGNYAIPLRPNQGTEELRDYFQYHIFVDVTNYTGETQHTQVSFSAGTSPVHLEFIADSQLCREYSPTAVASAHSYIGDTINVGVEMLLYKKSDAEAPIREKPNYRINVRSNRELDLTDVWKDIPYGTYHLILRAGQDTTYHQTIEWFSIQDKRVPTTDFLWAYQPQRQFDAHTPAMLYVGTAAKDTYIYYDVYAKGEKIDSQLLNVSDGKMSFSYSGGEEYGDAFTVLVSAVKNLSARSHTFSFARKKKNRSLSMKWSVFRDRLQPGQAEEWRLTVKDAQGKRPV